MKLSTFYRLVRKDFISNSGTGWICSSISYTKMSLMIKHQKRANHYIDLANIAYGEIHTLLKGNSFITSELYGKSMYTRELIGNPNAKLYTREYRTFILRFLEARAKLAGN